MYTHIHASSSFPDVCINYFWLTLYMCMCVYTYLLYMYLEIMTMQEVRGQKHKVCKSAPAQKSSVFTCTGSSWQRAICCSSDISNNYCTRQQAGERVAHAVNQCNCTSTWMHPKQRSAPKIKMPQHLITGELPLKVTVRGSFARWCSASWESSKSSAARRKKSRSGLHCREKSKYSSSELTNIPQMWSRWSGSFNEGRGPVCCEYDMNVCHFLGSNGGEPTEPSRACVWLLLSFSFSSHFSLVVGNGLSPAHWAAATHFVPSEEKK